MATTTTPPANKLAKKLNNEAVIFNSVFLIKNNKIKDNINYNRFWKKKHN